LPFFLVRPLFKSFLNPQTPLKKGKRVKRKEIKVSGLFRPLLQSCQPYKMPVLASDRIAADDAFETFDAFF
jgi:hypothetical protein